MSNATLNSTPDHKSGAKVAVVIAGWNQAEVTQKCLDSIARQSGVCPAVILVDNGSQPSLEQLLAFPSETTLLKNVENRGFAGGYNPGLRYALQQGFEYICLLNNDVVIAPDCLTELVQAAQPPHVGLVSAKIYLAAEPDIIWSVGATLDPWLLELKGNDTAKKGKWADEKIDKDFFPFCVVLLKRAVLEEVGLLDEGFFVYYEDLDYCQRLKRTQWRCQLAPTAHAWHEVSTSSGGKNTPFARYWFAQASGRYFRKHGGWHLLLIVPYRLASAMKFSLKMLWQRKMRTLGAYWLGLARGWLTGRADTPPPGWVSSPPG
ncbi:MAG: glycosyltransferase family 2 protein [Anaerolineales bacterium]|nr:glycosyltransferase family 2 protein [Anaerolineales bacterium]MCB0017386.1 glycosyltransferase family 2 protein [Anaerolineales bacterium]